MEPEKDPRRPLKEAPQLKPDAEQQSDKNNIYGARVGFNAEAIPVGLRQIPQWVAWQVKKPSKPGDKIGKIPVNPFTGAAASTTDPATWGTFEQALACVQQHHLAGVGFVLTVDQGIVGTDLDHCRDPKTGAIEQWAIDVVTALNTYTEVSPSGTGLHLLARGKLPLGRRRKGNFEMYDSGRFLTVTGVLQEGAHALLEERTAELGKVHEAKLGQAGGQRAKAGKTSSATDDELTQAAISGKDGPRFKKLWEGDATDYPSQSEADLALCILLAGMTAGDAGAIDRLFRRSGLFRDKWDEQRGEHTYGARTIQEAISRAPGSGLIFFRPVSIRAGSEEIQLRCLLARGKTRATVEVTFPDGAIYTDKVDLASASGRERLTTEIENRCPVVVPEELLADLEDLAAELQGAARDGGDGRDGDSPQSDADADLLVSLVVGAPDVELFHTPGQQDAEAFVTITSGDQRTTMAVKSGSFKYWLIGAFRGRFGRVPSANGLQNALLAIAAEAIYSAEEHDVHVRLAEADGAIWLDLCDAGHRAVKVTADGWDLVPSVGVAPRFVQRRGMRALPEPQRGGSIELLRDLVNVPDWTMWVLFVAVLVAYLRPRGPFPILVVSGEQGSAKSFLCRLLRLLIDPSLVPLRRPPRDDRDLMIAASNSWVVAFDNLSHMTASLSDALCSLATRSGFGSRELYSNDEEKLFDVTRPVVINGIGDIATRADLLDRAVILHLPSILEEKRISEAELEARFEKVHALVLGALLDAVSVALKNLPHVQIPKLPRMADFAVWATAAESAFGWEPGTFMKAFESNQADADVIAVECSTLGSLILVLMQEHTQWKGTASELRSQLEARFGEERTRKQGDWPKSASALSNVLKRVAPNLRRSGIDVSFNRKTGGNRDRTILIQRLETGKPPSRPSPPSQDPKEGPKEVDSPGRRGDDVPDERRPEKPASAASPEGQRDGRDAWDDAFPESSPLPKEVPREGHEPDRIYEEVRELFEDKGADFGDGEVLL